MRWANNNPLKMNEYFTLFFRNSIFADFLEYDAGQLETAVMLSEMVKDLVWPDFKVGAEGPWVVFRRVEERYFHRKNKTESSK